MAFNCDMCSATYVNKQNLLRHVRNAHASLWTCVRCKQTFHREDNFTYHKRTCDFKASGKRPAQQEQVGGGVKRKKTNINWQNQALDNTVVNFSISLSNKEETVANIYEVLSDSMS